MGGGFGSEEEPTGVGERERAREMGRSRGRRRSRGGGRERGWSRGMGVCDDVEVYTCTNAC